MRALVIVMLLASLAHAEDRKRAEQFFRAGEAAFRKQNYAAAASNFELAYQAAAIPEIAFSAAQAYRRQYFIEATPRPQLARRAIELYRLYLDKVKTEGRRGDAADGIAEMQRELDKQPDAIKPQPPMKPPTRLAVSVVIAGEESKRALGDLSPPPSTERFDARATLDGKPVELFTPIDVTPGEHTAEVVAKGYHPAKKTMRVVEGYEDIIELVLEPQRAKLAVTTDGNVRVDGIAGGATRELDAGRHVITVTKRGHVPQAREVTLVRGQEHAVTIDLVPTRQRRAVRWVLIGSGVVGGLALASTGIALYYDGEMSDIDAERRGSGITEARADDYRAAVDRRDLFRSSALVLGGAAVVGAGVALGMYLFDHPSTEGVQIVPAANGVGVAGRF